MMLAKRQNVVYQKVFNMLLQNVLSQFFIVKCFTKPRLSQTILTEKMGKFCLSLWTSDKSVTKITCSLFIFGICK